MLLRMSIDATLLNPFLSVFRFDVPRTQAYTFAHTLGDIKALPKDVAAVLTNAALLRANVRRVVSLVCGCRVPGGAGGITMRSDVCARACVCPQFASVLESSPPIGTEDGFSWL